MSSLRSLNDIPVKYRSIFSPIPHFNHVQSEAFHDAINTTNHMVVSAPTGSGKTKIFELAIVKLLLDLERTGGNRNDVKIVYVAPTKALCNEVYHMWQIKFKAFDMNVALVTGDSDPAELADLNDLSSYQIAITTPEKWDAMTRKWKDHREVASSIRLLLIDEIHLVGDAIRGPTLEAIVTRTKCFAMDGNSEQIRLISVSALLPNIEDFAQWIGAGQSTGSVRSIQINEDKRPVPLTRRVFGYPSDGNSFKFNMTLTNALPNIVKQLLTELPDKQILIFCSSRYDVESSVRRLLDNVQIRGLQPDIMRNVSSRIKDEKLRTSVEHGIGFHHAGLSFEDREHIENLYKSNGSIKIMVSTNTLAMGVNLPAHTVIIRGTDHFVNGSTQEISESILLQMMGRAGRQQYCKCGRVYIMTHESKRKFYEDFTVGRIPIQSHLHKKLDEFLNVEIALNTINNCDETLMQWIRTTFLYARHTKTMTVHDADARLKDMCQHEIRKLKNSDLIDVVGTDGALSIKPFGTIMAKYFLSISTMNSFRGFRGSETIERILDKMVNCKEFSEFYLRRTEKKILNAINTGSRIRFLIPGKIESVPHKVNCLLQAVLSNVPIETTALQMEAQKMIQTAERMTNSLIEYFQCEQFGECSFDAVLSSMILEKSLRTQTWSDLQTFGQLDISAKDAGKLIRAGIGSIESLMKANSRDIEDILGKLIPFGTELIDEVTKKFPCYELTIEIQGNHQFVVRVTQKNIKYEATMETGLTLLIGDGCNRLILCEDICSTLNEDGFYEKLLAHSPKAAFGIAHLIHHGLVGVDKKIQFYCDPNSKVGQPLAKNVIMPSKKDETKKKVTPRKAPKASPIKKDQQTLSQYFKPSKKSRFEPIKETAFPANRVEMFKTIHRSPDLFSTPQNVTQKPVDKLYDFPNNSTGTDSHLPSKGSNIARETDTKYHSPCLAETPIKHKIEEQRITKETDFVSANDIFNVNTKANNTTEANAHEDTDMPDVDFSQFMELVNEEYQLQCGLAAAQKSTNKPSNGITAQILNRNVNSNKSTEIERDFEDCIESSDEQEVCPTQNHLDSRNEFFANDIALDDHADNNKTDDYKKSQAKEAAAEFQKSNSAAQVSRPFFELPKQTESHQRAPQMHKSSLSFDTSALSFQATHGSPKDDESGPPAKMQKLASNKVTLREFEFRPKPTMPANVWAQNNIRERREFMEVETSSETTDGKSSKKSLKELLAENEKKKIENDQNMKLMNLQIRPKENHQQPVSRTSLSTVFSRISRNDKESEMNADELMKQCEKRLQTDQHYKQNDYDMDYIRHKVLKFPPRQIDTQATNESLMPDSEDDFFLGDHSFATTNNGLFNCATPNTTSSFFSR